MEYQEYIAKIRRFMSEGYHVLGGVLIYDLRLLARIMDFPGKEGGDGVLLILPDQVFFFTDDSFASSLESQADREGIFILVNWTLQHGEERRISFLSQYIPRRILLAIHETDDFPIGRFTGSAQDLRRRNELTFVVICPDELERILVN